MKQQSTLSSAFQTNTGSSRFANSGRLALTTLCVSMVSFAAVPKALAAGANGTYEFKSASGYFKIEGESFRLPQNLVKRLAGFTSGDLTIRNNTLRLKRGASAKIVEDIGDDLNLDIEAKVSGPWTVVLSKSGVSYTGKTARPIVATFDGDLFGADISGKLVSKVSATVTGKTLTVVIRLSGGVEGEDFSGKLTLVGKR